MPPSDIIMAPWPSLLDCEAGIKEENPTPCPIGKVPRPWKRISEIALIFLEDAPKTDRDRIVRPSTKSETVRETIIIRVCPKDNNSDIMEFNLLKASQRIVRVDDWPATTSLITPP